MIKNRLDIKIKGTEKILNNRLKAKTENIIMTLFDAIASGHPVKTGQSLASWNISVDSPNDDHIINAPNTKKSWLSHSQAYGIAAGNIMGRLSLIRKGSDIRLFNNHEYVKYFEYGTTGKYAQAAQGIIRRAIAQVKASRG